jgi:hypothetical protein
VAKRPAQKPLRHLVLNGRLIMTFSNCDLLMQLTPRDPLIPQASVQTSFENHALAPRRTAVKDKHDRSSRTVTMVVILILWSSLEN